MKIAAHNIEMGRPSMSRNRKISELVFLFSICLTSACVDSIVGDTETGSAANTQSSLLTIRHDLVSQVCPTKQLEYASAHIRATKKGEPDSNFSSEGDIGPAVLKLFYCDYRWLIKVGAKENWTQPQKCVPENASTFAPDPAFTADRGSDIIALQVEYRPDKLHPDWELSVSVPTDTADGSVRNRNYCIEDLSSKVSTHNANEVKIDYLGFSLDAIEVDLHEACEPGQERIFPWVNITRYRSSTDGEQFPNHETNISPLNSPVPGMPYPSTTPQPSPLVRIGVSANKITAKSDEPVAWGPEKQATEGLSFDIQGVLYESETKLSGVPRYLYVIRTDGGNLTDFGVNMNDIVPMTTLSNGVTVPSARCVSRTLMKQRCYANDLTPCSEI